MHYLAEDITNDSSDGKLTGLNLFLGYDCRDSGNLEAGYAVLKKNVHAGSYPASKMVLYFTQKSPGSMDGSFWRIYAYGRDTDMPDEGSYIDIPYRPAQSRCGQEKIYPIRNSTCRPSSPDQGI